MNKLKNKFETELYKELRLGQRKGKYKLGYETEKLPFTLKRYYLPDFVLTQKDGSKIYIEAKGYFRPESRQKLLAVKAQHPGIDIRLIFYDNKKLYKGSKTKYNEWAEKNGFPWSIKSIPPEWLQ